MVTHVICRPPSAALLVFAVLAVFAAACDKVPLLAPTGTAISLFASSSTVPTNGEIEIIATLIEQGTATTGTGGTGGTGGQTTTTSTRGAGTPVQNGTLVSFTTNLGRIEPREARTNNGEVRVKFIADGQSGMATITAYSGGASAKLENLPVGGAAAKRITVTASPQSLSASGGTSVISARVETDLGSGIAGVPVTFTTTAGTLSTSTATTNDAGVATTTLTTDRQAEVTAVSGAQTGKVTVGLNPRLIGTFSASPQVTTAGTPVTFTVTSGTGANIQDAVINFGDGTQASLGSFSGSTTASHVYSAPGSYTATVTARDALGGSQSQNTNVTVGALPVVLSASPSNPSPNTPVTFTVSGVSTAQVSRYQWTFSDGRSFSTTGPQTTQSFATRGEKVIRVDVIGVDGGVLGSAETRLIVTGL